MVQPCENLGPGAQLSRPDMTPHRGSHGEKRIPPRSFGPATPSAGLSLFKRRAMIPSITQVPEFIRQAPLRRCGGLSNAESIGPGLGMALRRYHGAMWFPPMPEYDLKIMRAVAAVYRCGR